MFPSIFLASAEGIIPVFLNNLKKRLRQIGRGIKKNGIAIKIKFLSHFALNSKKYIQYVINHKRKITVPDRDITKITFLILLTILTIKNTFLKNPNGI